MSGGSTADIIGERPADYAGDVTPDEAWRMLSLDPEAQLVDVRTRAEWSFVGVVDLASLGKQMIALEWQAFPEMAIDPNFADSLIAELTARNVSSMAPVFFLCRSGARSRAAAIEITSRGYSACHNVAGGFEGDLDTDRHRGGVNGWKAAGLPWLQT